MTKVNLNIYLMKIIIITNTFYIEMSLYDNLNE
jgi:hypothetical protein